MTTRYHRAAKDGAVHILKKATKKDLNRKDDDGMTATLYTASNGHLKALETCCKRDGNPDECDYSGNSAVHLAAMNGNLACLKFLVSYGANVWGLDNDFHSPRDLAVIRNQQGAVQFLDAAMNEETRKNPKKVKDKQEKEKKKAEKRKQNYDRMLEDQYSAERRSSLIVGGTIRGRSSTAASSGGGRSGASGGGTVRSIGSTISKAFNKSSKKSTTLRSNMAPPIIEDAEEDQHLATERAAVVDPKQPVSNFILGKTPEMRNLDAPSNEQDDDEANFVSKFDRFAKPGQYHPFGTALRSNITSARTMFGALQENDDVTDDDVDRSDAIVPTSNRPTLEGVFEDKYNERERMWSNEDDYDDELSPLEEFLKQINLTEYTDLFLEQRLDMGLLMECSDGDLLNMGIPLGHRKIVLREVEERKRREAEENPETTLF